MVAPSLTPRHDAGPLLLLLLATLPFFTASCARGVAEAAPQAYDRVIETDLIPYSANCADSDASHFMRALDTTRRALVRDLSTAEVMRVTGLRNTSAEARSHAAELIISSVHCR